MSSYNFINEMQNDNIKTALIKVESLEKEYDVTLQQYQESVKNYITSLNSSTNLNLVELKGRTWWGKSALSEGTVNSKKECEDMCANSTQCSGATFNPVKHYCWTRSGDADITVGRDDDYALITAQKKDLSVMKMLNSQLLEINKKISDELRKIDPEVIEQYNEKKIKQQQLAESYKKLLEQKIEMDRQLTEYQSIEEEENNQSMYAHKQHMSLRIWVLLTSLILLVTIKNIFGAENPPLSMTIWLIIIIILIILSYSLSSRSGFMMWAIVIAVIALTKTGG